MRADATSSSAMKRARQALCRAFQREAPRLHRLTLRYHGRADAAEDAVQETGSRRARWRRAWTAPGSGSRAR